jgi:hypothetical protein
MDVMKQHAAFVKQMAGQGNMAIAGMFPFSDQGAKNRVHPLEGSNRLWNGDQNALLNCRRRNED